MIVKKKLTSLLITISCFSSILAQDTKLEIQFTDCLLENCASFQDDSRLHFAYLTVPEDYNHPEGRKLQLAFLIIKSKKESSQLDPIIHLTGGPGAKALSEGNINFFRDHPLGENRDIILMDFRGLGFSEPSFCPDLQAEIGEVIWQNFTPEEATDATLAHFGDCFEKLKTEGVNLNKYNTAMVVKDLEMLRVAMDIDLWNLWGISYGTRVAQTYMRDFPDEIRCAILDSPVPMGYPTTGNETKSYQRSLQAFFVACEKSGECQKAFPDVENRFYLAMESLKENPLSFAYKNAHEGKATLNFQDIHLVIQQILYIPDFYPAIPWLINGIENRDVEIFKNMLSLFQEKIDDFSDAMLVTVLKYDNGLNMSDTKTITTDTLHNALNYFDNVNRAVNRIDFISQDTLETMPVVSEIPSLILGGSIDPITPPFYGEVLHKSLKQSFLLEFPGKGHGLTGSTACAKNIAFDFLNDPYAIPQTNCITEMEANSISWVTNMVYNPRIASLIQQVLVEKRWYLLGGLTLLALTFISSIFALLLNLVRKKKKPTLPQIRTRNIIANLSAFMAIVLLAGITWFIVKTGSENEILLLIGLDGDANPIFYFSFLVLAGTLVSWVLYFRTLKNSTTGGGILYGLQNVSLAWVSVLIILFQLFPN